MRACASLQTAPQVVIHGSVFANVTVFTQQINPSYLTLVNGATYYVSVRATGAGAQGLSVVATSDAVEVSLSKPLSAFHKTMCCVYLLHPLACEQEDTFGAVS